MWYTSLALEYPRQTRSISCLFMTWLLASLGHPKSLYWICNKSKPWCFLELNTIYHQTHSLTQKDQKCVFDIIWGNWTWRGKSSALCHYNDVIMTMMASQITSFKVVYSTVYSEADQRKHQSSASLAFAWGIHRDLWIPHTKGKFRGKCFHLMTSSCIAIHNISKTSCNTSWVGVINKFPPFHYFLSFQHCQNTGYLLYIMFTFDRHHHSWAAETSIKYEYESKNIAGFFFSKSKMPSAEKLINGTLVTSCGLIQYKDAVLPV